MLELQLFKIHVKEEQVSVQELLFLILELYIVETVKTSPCDVFFQ